MTDDLVKRLRGLADCDARAGEPLGKCMREAADEIERLIKVADTLRDEIDWRIKDAHSYRSEIERLRAEYEHDTALMEQAADEIEKLRMALKKTELIAIELGEIFRVRNASDYAQGYADASDTISMMLRKLIRDTLNKRDKTNG